MGCEGGTSVTTPSDDTSETVQTVEITPEDPTVFLGDTVEFTATPRDSDGKVLSGYSIEWSSSDDSVVRITDDGVATALQVGEANIEATAIPESGTAVSGSTDAMGATRVAARRRPVNGVDVAPDSATIAVGKTVTLDATVYVGEQEVGRSVSWTSLDTALATVDDSGTVTGQGEGNARIVATSGEESDTARVEVEPVSVERVEVSPENLSLEVDQTGTLGATLYDADGNVLEDRDVTWSSSDAAVAEVDGSGSVTALAEGSVSIVAASEGKSATAHVDVGPVPVVRVEVSPESLTLEVDQTGTLDVTLYDADGNVLEDRDVTWSSSDDAVAEVDGSGTVTGQAKGEATVTATAGNGEKGTSSITVAEESASPSADGVPQPDSDDEVMYDIRAGGAQDLQAGDITTIDEATEASEFKAIDTERGSPTELGVTNTFLGDGTRAIVFPWLKNAGTDECKGNGLPPDGSQHNLFIGINSGFSSIGAGDAVVVQHKRYFGRTAADESDAAIGNVGAFDIAKTGRGRKWGIWLRPDAPTRPHWMQNRSLWQFDVNNDEPISLVVGEGDGETETSGWWPDAHIPGGPFTFTVRIQLESEEGAGDGETQFWVDDTLIAEETGVTTYTSSFAALQLGGPTWICPAETQTEYMWDVVVWKER